MHTFASAATGLVAIGYLANLVNASPVAADHRDVTVVGNQVLENPTPTLEAAAAGTSNRCCTTSCDWCHPSDSCVGNCGMHFFFIHCCSSEMTKNAVLVHNIDDIDWKEYLAKEVPTAISSPEAETEHYKALAAADQASFDHYKKAPTPTSYPEAEIEHPKSPVSSDHTELFGTKRDSSEADDADGFKHCCTFGCGFCTPQRCVKEKGTMECNRGTFAECCDHKHTKNSIFVESADDIPWELFGDDWLGKAYETLSTLTKRTVTPTKAVEAVSVVSASPDAFPVPICCFSNCGNCIPQLCPPYNCVGAVLYDTCCAVGFNSQATIYDVSFASPLEEIEFHRSIMAGKPAPTISIEELRKRVAARDVGPTMSIEYASVVPAVATQTPEPDEECSDDEDSDDDDDGEPAYPIHLRDGGDNEYAGQGYCCQSGCVFCRAKHKCFLEFGCNQMDKPQYNTCCTLRDGMVWVPDDKGPGLEVPPPESHV